MEMNNLFLAGKSPIRKLQLQGPRPPPLSLHKDSHKIRKPPVAPANRHHQPPHPPPIAPANRLHQPPQPPPRKPVIIYAVSPKVIHVNPNEFMALVQRLTGSSAPRVERPDPFPNYSRPVSPAARYATVENVDKSRVRDTDNIGDADVAGKIRRVGSRTGLMTPPRNDFMALVQRLTDSSATTRVHHPDPLNTDGAVMVENARKFGVTNNISDDMAEFGRVGSIRGSMPPRVVLPSHDNIGDGVADEFRRVGLRTGSVPVGILSPGPDSLRPVPATFFSPLSNGNPLSFIHDFISPAGFYNKGLNYSELSSLLQSPTPFISPRMISPIPSMDLFNNFFDM